MGSLLSRPTKTIRTTREWESLLTSCNQNSSNTNCKLKKPKPLPTTISLSSERLTTSSLLLKNVLKPLKLHSPECANLVLVAPLHANLSSPSKILRPEISPHLIINTYHS